uniref:polynucleotide adenylyltransferase n=1 Tax=Daphnia galeata TaxID=27404 RepID=A0A8J2WE07_9CRUS|nr:unnamed protein product [Daphnia galeata]
MNLFRLPALNSGTLELSGTALKRLEDLKIGGIDVTAMATMDALKMLRLSDVVNGSNNNINDQVVVDELTDLTSAKLSLAEAETEVESLSEHSSGDSDSGYDLGGDGDLEDVSLVSTASVSGGSLSSRSSVTGGSTESLPLAVAQQLQQQQQQQQRFAVLSYEQVSRVHDVMNETVSIHGRGNFPTLELRLRDLVTLVRAKLEADGVPVKDMRINGGAASYVLALDRCQPQAYNDLDLIFGVDLSSARTYDRIKTAVLDSLLDFLPAGVSRTRMLSCSLKEAYVSKMVKVTEGDRWSLISLGTNHRGKNVELKFVHNMRRQFEFSVDSFQIILDSLVLFYDCASTMPISESFYPTVVAESVYGDFRQAHYHLHHKMIATRNPEEIRGGGLLKYCNLLVKDYRPADPDQIKTFERYMCSRFFIDFPDVGQQRLKLDNYLWNHFVGADEALNNGGYFYAPAAAPPPTLQTSLPPPTSTPPPASCPATSGSNNTSTVVTTASPPSVPALSPSATPCYPCSPPCACSCAWMACS